MTEWQEKEWAYFLDDSKDLAYCDTCLDCDRECKQSFRVISIYCPYHEMIVKERARERRKKKR